MMPETIRCVQGTRDGLARVLLVVANTPEQARERVVATGLYTDVKTVNSNEYERVPDVDASIYEQLIWT